MLGLAVVYDVLVIQPVAQYRTVIVTRVGATFVALLSRNAYDRSQLGIEAGFVWLHCLILSHVQRVWRFYLAVVLRSLQILVPDPVEIKNQNRRQLRDCGLLRSFPLGLAIFTLPPLFLLQHLLLDEVVQAFV